MTTRKNRRTSLAHSLFILLIPTAALGTYLFPVPVAGGGLFGFRVLLLATIVAMPFLRRDPECVSHRTGRFYLLMGVIWLLWGGIGLLWAPDIVAGVKEWLAVALGFAIGIVFLCLKGYSEKGLQAIGWGWSIAFLLTALIAAWEIITKNHLPGSHISIGGEPQVISTFGNPNNYGAFLILTYPFLWLTYEKKQKQAWRWMLLTFILLTPLLLVFSASRLAIIGFLSQIIILGFAALKRPLRKRITMLILAASLIILLAGMGTATTQFKIKLLRLWQVTTLQSETHVEKNKIRPIQIRENLTRNGIWMAIITHGKGVGPGGYEIIQRNHPGPYPTRGLVNPHNFWIEILSEYGILAFILFTAWYFSLYGIAYQNRGRPEGIILLVSLVGYIPASVANSAYIEQQINWVFLACVMILAIYLTVTRPEITLTDVKSR